MNPERAISEHVRFHPGQLNPLVEPLVGQPRGGVSANGVLGFEPDDVKVRFTGGAGVYQLKCAFQLPAIANGYGAKFKLENWRDIQYVAIGYTDGDEFVHVKVRHNTQGEYITFKTSHADLAFLCQNNWRQKDPATVQDLRIFIKGMPVPDAFAILSVSYLECWLEESRHLYDGWAAAPRRGVLEPLFTYWKQCFPEFVLLAENYLHQGRYPISGDTLASWDVFEDRPLGHDSVSTNRFSWHALHAASILLLAYRESRNIAYLFAARELVSRWIDQSYRQVDPDQKYAWYDHGTAERTAVFVALWYAGLEVHFDYRFMARLASVLFRHGQLLASDAFYAIHQPTPYHNHACFQDVALIAAATCLDHIDCSNSWLDKAELRLQKQLKFLVHHEQGYAVFTENSIGYHCRMQELAQLAGQLLQLSDKGKGIAHTALLMSRWSQDFVYPDGRWPGHGDTFKRANPAVRQDVERVRSHVRQSIFLPENGYCLLKGVHEDVLWMLGVVASNLNPTHKHQDDLSCFLWLGGVEWLTDPSFYSHEYQQAEVAYLRSARAHNMLHVPHAKYSTAPDTVQARLTADVHQEGVVQVRGTNYACEGYVIYRTLDCPSSGDCFSVRCTDRFEALQGTESTAPGELSFHLADGVQISAWDVQDERSIVQLYHPASPYRLTLTISTPPAFGNDTVWAESSFSGISFLEKVSTTAIRVRLLPYNDCTWTLNVSAS